MICRSIAFFLLFLVSCGRGRNDENLPTNKSFKHNKWEQRQVSPDSLKPPSASVVKGFESKSLKLGQPLKVSVVRETINPSKAEEMELPEQNIIIPGKGGIKGPLRLQALANIIIPGDPDQEVAKAMTAPDESNSSVRFFGKLNGLRHGKVRDILEDKSGNIWFATDGGGAARFDGKYFTHYTMNEGLGNNLVYDMIEDRKGCIYFATRGGISRYDGHRFFHFNLNNGLRNEVVTCILEDREGAIWFGTYGGGIGRFDGSYIYHFGQESGLVDDYVLSMYEDSKGNIWVGTQAGITKYDGIGFTNYLPSIDGQVPLVRCISEDKDKLLWFGTNLGALVFNEKKFYKHDLNGKISTQVVRSMHLDRHKQLWMGTSSGELFVRKDNKFISFTAADGLRNKEILSIMEDRSGAFWLGTWGSGVARYDGTTFMHFPRPDGKNREIIEKVVSGSKGVIWLSSRRGLIRYERGNFQFYSKEQGLSSSEVYDVIEDSRGRIWLGTWGAGVCCIDGDKIMHLDMDDGLLDNRISCIVEAKDGIIWIGSFGGAMSFDGKMIRCYSTKQGLPVDFVMDIQPDKAGDIWIATERGVCKMSQNKVYQYDDNGKPVNVAIHTLHLDNQGRIWFGTEGAGLRYVNGSSIHALSTGPEIDLNHTLSIADDWSGNMWVGTPLGVSYIPQGKLKQQLLGSKQNDKDTTIRQFGYEDGFLGIGCNNDCMLFTNTGELWVGANDRLTIIKTQKLFPEVASPNIKLTGLRLNDKKIKTENEQKPTNKDSNSQQQKIEGILHYNGLSRWYRVPQKPVLSYRNNFLTFCYLGITTYQPAKVMYSYRLDGVNTDWSPLTNRTEVNYGNLRAGSYNFRVKARSSAGVWSKEMNYSFSILPPWWQTWWAYILYVIAAFSGIVAYTRWHGRALRARQQELEVKIDEATVLIRNQKQAVEDQKHLVEEKNREILDSIEYAKRIQTAILPPPRVVKEFLKNSFILYIPKDIVAGDFYWMENIDDTIYFAACDCTGHGVPGAMVSVVCNNALNRSLNEYSKRLPSEIFDKTRELVIENFAKSDEEVQDGMDASLAALDVKNRTLLWSGANNPLWIIKKNSSTNEYVFEEIKADKQPIGKGYETKPFTTHQIQLNEGDTIYLFTDGYADQFGGEKNKKLTKAKFRELLLGLASLSMDEQRTKLLDFHNTYRGSNEQVDDICVMGVRV